MSTGGTRTYPPPGHGYTVQTDPPTPSTEFHSLLIPSPYTPVVAAVTALDTSAGSDCGSSSGLGGMKESISLIGGVSEDSDRSSASSNQGPTNIDTCASTSNNVTLIETSVHRGTKRHIRTTSDSDTSPKDGRAFRDRHFRRGTWSKQSGASSSGKGSSTGASPTGPKTSVRSPPSSAASAPSLKLHHDKGGHGLTHGTWQNGSLDQFFVNDHRHNATNHFNPSQTDFPCLISSGSNAYLPEAQAVNGAAAPLYTMTVGPTPMGGAQGTSFDMVAPMGGSSGPFVLSTATETTSTQSSGVDSHIINNYHSTKRLSPNAQVNCYQATSGNQKAQSVHSVSQSGSGVTCNAGGNPTALSTQANTSNCGPPPGSRGSSSPPIVNGFSTGSGLGGVGNPPQLGQHAVYVHVNPGETLSVRVGPDIQHIPGPATVRMVSANPGPPVPLPIHVPPGHTVQQIVDEQGVLRHLILSPQTPIASPNGPFAPPMQTGPHPTPGQAPVMPHSGPGLVGGVPPNPFPAPFTPHIPPHHVPLECSLEGGCSDVRPSWQVPSKTRSRNNRYTPNEEVVNGPELETVEHEKDSNTASSEDEDSEKLHEMLARITPPQVLEVHPRSALVQWQALDCSEASAIGGPFPQIDASEFTYDVLVYEKRPDAQQSSKYDGADDQTCVWLKDLKPSTEYFVRLQAHLKERGLSGNASAPIGFKTKPTTPDKPVPPRLNRRSRNWFTLFWKKPCDNGARVHTYHLEMNEGRDAEDTFRNIYSGDLEQFKVTKLQPNSLYGVRLCAENEHGKSEYSDVLLVQTNGAPPTSPDAPQLLKATSDSLQLAWTKRAEDDTFRLFMEEPSSGHGFQPAAAPTDETVATVANLFRNTEYRFYVASRNDDGESPPSGVLTCKTLPTRPQAPHKPFVKEKVKPNSVKLAWQPPKETGGGDVTAYQLEYCADPICNSLPKNWTVIFNGNEREHLVTGLLPGIGYKFRLNCSTTGGDSPWSDVLQLSTPPVVPSPPAAPEPVGSKQKPTQIHVKWAPAASNGGAEIGCYELCMDELHTSTKDNKPVYSGTKTEFVVGVSSPLLPGRPYCFRVRAQNRAGWSGWSDKTDISTAPGPPDTPRHLRLANGPSPSNIQLTWQAPAHCNGAPISEYKLMKAVKRSSTPGSCDTPPSTPTSPTKSSPRVQSEEGWEEFCCVYSGKDTNVDLKDLTPATEYAFKLVATNCAGSGPWTSLLVTATPPGPPGVPEHFAAEPISTDQVHVSWDTPIDNGSALSAYCLEVADAASQTSSYQLDSAHISSHVVADLKPESNYKFRLQALNSVGCGPWSNFVKVTTFSKPPPAPVIELVSAGHNSIKMKWSDTKPPPTNQQYTYCVEVENRVGSFSPCYEGPLRSCKATRLTECCRYLFRIRAQNQTGGVGPWSEPVMFTTLRSPPPPIKSPPRVTEIAADSWQVEWSTVKSTGLPSGDKLHYALQISSAKNDEWKSVYVGPCQSFTLSPIQPSTLYKVRVCTVRLSPSTPPTTPKHSAAATHTATSAIKDKPLVETMGPPTNVTQFTTQAIAVNERLGSNSVTSSSVVDAGSEGFSGQSQGWSDGHWAALILIAFSTMALFMAFFIQRFIGSEN